MICGTDYSEFHQIDDEADFWKKINSEDFWKKINSRDFWDKVNSQWPDSCAHIHCTQLFLGPKIAKYYFSIFS